MERRTEPARETRARNRRVTSANAGGATRPVQRRDFLKTVGSASAGLLAVSGAVPAGAAPEQQPKIPQVPFGPHKISRLVCGANPFHAGSHLTSFVNREMKAYYTLEQTLKTLRRCQEVGINFWQGSDNHHETYRRFCDEGGKMHYISLGKDGPDSGEYMKALIDAGCIGIAHHGEVTDSLFKSGKIDEIHDYLKRVRDAGQLVGVSTHMPAVVDYVESKGWDIDFYMTCVYERHRSAEALKKLLGHVPLPVGEVYLQSDPPRMFKMIRQTKRTCLAFKILAAGRLCDRKQWIEEAFRQTYQSIKPTDAVIIGIYDRYTDQPAENAAYARRFSPLSGSA